MNFELFGIPFNFTPGNVILAGVITFLIFLIHNFFRAFKRFAPYKNKEANESIFFIHLIHKDYFNDYQGFAIDGREEFSRKLNQLAMLFDLYRMQDEKYNKPFEEILENHHRGLKEAYFLFDELKRIDVAKREDVEKVVKKVQATLNLMILDINEKFKDERPAA